ncbi:MAG: BNR-4 repeat-containing protein, partial [Pirellulales bacterium]|nr:BNR-4 repeat-containing protein [Pirellulales bacterium]
DNMIYFNGYDTERGEWFPASECPFDFHDTDGDGQSEAVVRVSGVPLEYDPKNENPDVANNVNTSSAARNEKTRKMGALNVRYGIDIDNMSSKQRPLHYDMGFNLIGRQPYQYPDMKRTNPLRRPPKTTICIPHSATRKMAETYPAEQTGFSWREFRDDARQLGFGPLADDDRRWEGIFWTWSRRVMHNTGGPTQTWNMRREFRPTPSTRRELYYSSVDHRIHLKGATEGWIRIGHFGNREPLGEIRYFDTDKDRYFDRWEVYREGTAMPVRTSTVRDPGARDLPADWDKLIELYTKEILPEAIRSNEALMGAMRLVDPDFVVPSPLRAALKSSDSDTEKRYIEDIIREWQYNTLREKLSAASSKMMEKPSWESRRLHPSPPSVDGWKLALQLAELDTAYGEGRYEDAVKILKAITAQRKKSDKKTTDKDETSKSTTASQGVWYSPGVAEGYGSRRPDKSYCGVKYSCVYPGKPTVYSGPMATYCAWHRPMAVHAPGENKTFFVFGNSRNSPAISFYDHAGKTFARPVVLGTNPNGDAHRNPTLLIDEKGYLYVFYGAHGHPSHVVRSAAPYDISKWEKMAEIEDRNTYPQPWQLKQGELFVSYRGNPQDWYYRKSTDGAVSWQPPVKLIEHKGNSIYAVTVAESGTYPRKIHIAWERMGGGTPEEIRTKALWARRYNVYYACSDNGGSTWRRSDGSKYQLPITETAAEKIHDSGERGVWLKDIQLGPCGKPYMLFIDADVHTYESKWKVARSEENRWRISDVTTGDHMYDGGALLILGSDDIRVYAPTTAVQDHEDGGEIEEWRSVDGGDSWTNSRHITSGSKLSHNHVKTVFNQRQGDFRMMWNYGDSVYPPSTKDVYLYYFGEAPARPARMRFN